MSPCMHLDDRFKNGVWYDQRVGEYCEIIELDNTIALCEPESTEPYYLFSENNKSKKEAIHSINSDFAKVSTEAVENPVKVVKDSLELMKRNNQTGLSSHSYKESVDLTYACQQVEIQE